MMEDFVFMFVLSDFVSEMLQGLLLTQIFFYVIIIFSFLLLLLFFLFLLLFLNVEERVER